MVPEEIEGGKDDKKKIDQKKKQGKDDPKKKGCFNKNK